MSISKWFDQWSGEPSEDWLRQQRLQMVEDQLRRRGVWDKRVLEVMARVPRHAFVPPAQAHEAYEDRPLSIGQDQTISQPYIVGYMTELCACRPGARVLEIGTGSGYQTAVLAELAGEVYTIERIEALQQAAMAVLERLGYGNIRYRLGDGFQGWPDAGPFDAIVVTAAPPSIPPRLQQELADGGRLVLPVGEDRQELVQVTRRGDTFESRDMLPVRFVPMVTGSPESS